MGKEEILSDLIDESVSVFTSLSSGRIQREAKKFP
jgi:hypothetical protein